MMSKKCKYALKALIRLGKEYGGGNEDHRSRDGNRDRVLSVVAHATREPAGLATRERGPTDSHLRVARGG